MQAYLNHPTPNNLFHIHHITIFSIMKKAFLLSLLLVASLAASCRGQEDEFFDSDDTDNVPLRLKSDDAEADAVDLHYLQGITCSSWRWAVETYNIINWNVVPEECASYVGNYIESHKYQDDSKAVNREAYFYARDLNRTYNNKEIWIFDVEETLLSNAEYYKNHGWGSIKYNKTDYLEWTKEGKATVLPETLKCYKKFLKLNIKIVLITGRDDSLAAITKKNLKDQGYRGWHKLILKSSKYSGLTSRQYKAEQRRLLKEQGYTILGSTGDQWSDITGRYPAKRGFKLPNPMYFLA